MATWKPDPTSRRTTPRPKGWKALRARILRRDRHRCTWIQGLPDGGSWSMATDPRRCITKATDVDHMGTAEDHSEDMLRSLCEPHHDTRTSQQANAARWNKHQHKRMRAQQPHPGIRNRA